MKNAIKKLLILSVTLFPQASIAQSLTAEQSEYELKSRRLAESLTASCGVDFLVADLERAAFFRIKDVKNYNFIVQEMPANDLDMLNKNLSKKVKVTYFIKDAKFIKKINNGIESEWGYIGQLVPQVDPRFAKDYYNQANNINNMINSFGRSFGKEANSGDEFPADARLINNYEFLSFTFDQFQDGNSILRKATGFGSTRDAKLVQTFINEKFPVKKLDCFKSIESSPADIAVNAILFHFKSETGLRLQKENTEKINDICNDVKYIELNKFFPCYDKKNEKKLYVNEKLNIKFVDLARDRWSRVDSLVDLYWNNKEVKDAFGSLYDALLEIHVKDGKKAEISRAELTNQKITIFEYSKSREERQKYLLSENSKVIAPWIEQLKLLETRK